MDDSRTPPLYTVLILTAIVLTLIVILIGAYTRLIHAGLGCPDWPGCYGQFLITPNAQIPAFPKAATEMVHRYLAGTLGILVILLGITLKRSKTAYGLIAVVIGQACLGMWTVTWKLLPTVVMSHLIGGLTLLSLLWLVFLQHHPHWIPATTCSRSTRLWSNCALMVLPIQMILGGWTSANYAALPCLDFPTCNHLWIPPVEPWLHAFNPIHPIGPNYEFGLLSNLERTSIQLTHRWGALFTAITLCALALQLYRLTHPFYRTIAMILVALIGLQIILGILNISAGLPLANALLHTLTAALLLLCAITIRWGIAIA
jgi:cytochrome c oxidase assembly protein subunit 15